LPQYDYYCPTCQTMETRRVPYDVADNQVCGQCGTDLARRPSAPAFTVKGGTPKFHEGR